MLEGPYFTTRRDADKPVCVCVSKINPLGTSQVVVNPDGWYSCWYSPLDRLLDQLITANECYIYDQFIINARLMTALFQRVHAVSDIVTMRTWGSR